jgi:hypothetical protein
MAFAGLMDGQGPVLAILHPNLPFAPVELGLRRRWPGWHVRPGAVPVFPPPRLDEATLVALALRQRGIEPLRVVIAPQRTSLTAEPPRYPDGPFAEPMPVAF